MRRVRRWPWILASLRVLGVGAVAYGQREVAAEWREGAEALETQRDAGIERDVFSQVTGRIAAATDALDDCVGRLFELQTASVDAFNRSTAGEPVDVVPLNATAAQVNASCNEARNAAADAGAAADRLLGP